MREATGGQPIYIRGGPEYEISYYYGAPIQPLARLPYGHKNKGPLYLLTWNDQVARDGPASSQQMLASHPTLDGRRLVLLKVGTGGFESSPKD